MIAAACGGSASAPVAAPEVSSRCPDLAKTDEVGAFDFATEYQLSRDAADKLKAAALAATELGVLGDKLDADLGIACSQLAADLGASGDWRSGNDACAAAIKALQDARARLGPRATTRLVVRAPTCSVPSSAMTKCASICDSSVPSGRLQASCGLRAGRCDGNCDGLCEPKVASRCPGTCSGSCEGPMRGACGGRCKGTCDGRPVNGPCLGTCAGTCDRGPIEGECRGDCGGACRADKPSICDGTCVGACSVELEGSRCAGDVKAPEVSTDCRARCELEIMNKTECGAPQVGLVVSGSADRAAADALKASVDKALPGLLKVLLEVGGAAGERVVTARAILEQSRGGFAEIARSGGEATAAAAQRQLERCFDEPFKAAIATADAAKTGLDRANGVRDELGAPSR